MPIHEQLSIDLIYSGDLKQEYFDDVQWMNLLFQYPEIYQTGMSVAPVANQLYYDNIYQE